MSLRVASTALLEPSPTCRVDGDLVRELTALGWERDSNKRNEIEERLEVLLIAIKQHRRKGHDSGRCPRSTHVFTQR